jgi:hypothetical protein
MPLSRGVCTIHDSAQLPGAVRSALVVIAHPVANHIVEVLVVKLRRRHRITC